MVTVVQGKVCAKNHPDRLSRLATIHQRYRRTDRQTDGSYGIGLDLTVGQLYRTACIRTCACILDNFRLIIISCADAARYTETCSVWMWLNREGNVTFCVIRPLSHCRINMQHVDEWKASAVNIQSWIYYNLYFTQLSTCNTWPELNRKKYAHKLNKLLYHYRKKNRNSDYGADELMHSLP